MKKQTAMMSAFLITGFLSTTAFAETQQTQARQINNQQGNQASLNHSIGVGSGFVTGALLGGPIGAFIGTGAGFFLADHVNQDQKAEHMATRLEKAEADYAQLLIEHEMLLAANQQASSQIETVQVNRVVPTESHIQFLTASSQLQPHYYAALDTLADAALASASVKIELFGYADRRGDSDYNQTLSEKRVAAVREYLVRKGVSENRIDVTSYGEDQPVLDAQNWEYDFFDRRVVIRVQSDSPVMTAANP